MSIQRLNRLNSTPDSREVHSLRLLIQERTGEVERLKSTLASREKYIGNMQLMYNQIQGENERLRAQLRAASSGENERGNKVPSNNLMAASALTKPGTSQNYVVGNQWVDVEDTIEHMNRLQQAQLDTFRSIQDLRGEMRDSLKASEDLRNFVERTHSAEASMFRAGMSDVFQSLQTLQPEQRRIGDSVSTVISMLTQQANHRSPPPPPPEPEIEVRPPPPPPETPILEPEVKALRTQVAALRVECDDLKKLMQGMSSAPPPIPSVVVERSFPPPVEPLQQYHPYAPTPYHPPQHVMMQSSHPYVYPPQAPAPPPRQLDPPMQTSSAGLHHIIDVSRSTTPTAPVSSGLTTGQGVIPGPGPLKSQSSNLVVGEGLPQPPSRPHIPTQIWSHLPTGISQGLPLRQKPPAQHVYAPIDVEEVLDLRANKVVSPPPTTYPGGASVAHDVPRSPPQSYSEGVSVVPSTKAKGVVVQVPANAVSAFVIPKSVHTGIVPSAYSNAAEALVSHHRPAPASPMENPPINASVQEPVPSGVGAKGSPQKRVRMSHRHAAVSE